ncbi:MAG TPA: AMP-binding protein [Acidimicrobiia bacterium]|nr:AMP-binding protein [Acidimicrobiia bacterium]
MVTAGATPCTTADLLRDAAAAHPDREAYVHGEKRVTYGWLDRATDGFAATLVDHGVQPGDVVSLLLSSTIKFATCYLGALRVGAITSALNLRLGPAEKASILGRTEPTVTVVGDGVEVPEGVDAGRTIHVSELGHAFAADPPASLPPLTPTDPACVVWTSGTTGEPKGAVFDHETMAAISRNIGELTRPGDRRLLALPFAHVGYMTRMWDELANGTTIVLVGEPWSAQESLRLIRDESITMATGVPTQWSLVLAHPDIERTDFSRLRVAALGGASIPPELVRQIRKVLGCPVVTRYTSTEAGVCTSTLVGDDDEVVATTVGRPAPEVEVRIVDPAGGAEQPVGEVGEVCCKSPAMMRGYWRDPERTAEVIDADGWLHTGDLGVVGADGNLRIVGRLKEMYIRGGYNVYPAEVEAALAEQPSVARAAVVGVPDPVLGEVGVAFVVAVAGAAEPTLETLRAWCRDRLADYKAPDRLELVDDLPLTSMLKVDKRALAARTTEER